MAGLFSARHAKPGKKIFQLFLTRINKGRNACGLPFPRAFRPVKSMSSPPHANRKALDFTGVSACVAWKKRVLKNGYGIILAAFLGTVSTKAIGKKRKEKQMNANAMKVYRYGRMGTYWDAQGKPQHGLVPADRTSSMWYADVYKHACYYDRRSAEAGLAQVKADCRARAEAAAQVLAADPVMAQRMRDGMATQEDARKPSYDAFSTALRAQELWAFVEGMQVLATTHGTTVCHLNTLPDGDNEWSRSMREEIEAVMRHYGRCFVEWSCLGHTRAAWQSAAVAQWVAKAHPEWEATTDGVRCSIKA